ncbi:hypothetical protein SNEBB_007057 [Seison nebaliae]|nr:hypothetical protein SNEBB_007057 [Seison nebaliae]
MLFHLLPVAIVDFVILPFTIFPFADALSISPFASYEYSSSVRLIERENDRASFYELSKDAEHYHLLVKESDVPSAVPIDLRCVQSKVTQFIRGMPHMPNRTTLLYTDSKDEDGKKQTDLCSSVRNMNQQEQLQYLQKRIRKDGQEKQQEKDVEMEKEGGKDQYGKRQRIEDAERDEYYRHYLRQRTSPTVTIEDEYGGRQRRQLENSHDMQLKQSCISVKYFDSIMIDEHIFDDADDEYLDDDDECFSSGEIKSYMQNLAVSLVGNKDEDKKENDEDEKEEEDDDEDNKSQSSTINNNNDDDNVVVVVVDDEDNGNENKDDVETKKKNEKNDEVVDDEKTIGEEREIIDEKITEDISTIINNDEGEFDVKLSSNAVRLLEDKLNEDDERIEGTSPTITTTTTTITTNDEKELEKDEYENNLFDTDDGDDVVVVVGSVVSPNDKEDEENDLIKDEQNQNRKEIFDGETNEFLKECKGSSSTNESSSEDEKYSYDNSSIDDYFYEDDNRSKMFEMMSSEMEFEISERRVKQMFSNQNKWNHSDGKNNGKHDNKDISMSNCGGGGLVPRTASFRDLNKLNNWSDDMQRNNENIDDDHDDHVDDEHDDHDINDMMHSYHLDHHHHQFLHQNEKKNYQSKGINGMKLTSPMEHLNNNNLSSYKLKHSGEQFFNSNRPPSQQNNKKMSNESPPSPYFSTDNSMRVQSDHSKEMYGIIHDIIDKDFSGKNDDSSSSFQLDPSPSSSSTFLPSLQPLTTTSTTTITTTISTMINSGEGALDKPFLLSDECQAKISNDNSMNYVSVVSLSHVFGNTSNRRNVNTPINNLSAASTSLHPFSSSSSSSTSKSNDDRRSSPSTHQSEILKMAKEICTILPTYEEFNNSDDTSTDTTTVTITPTSTQNIQTTISSSSSSTTTKTIITTTTTTTTTTNMITSKNLEKRMNKNSSNLKSSSIPAIISYSSSSSASSTTTTTTTTTTSPLIITTKLPSPSPSSLNQMNTTSLLPYFTTNNQIINTFGGENNNKITSINLPSSTILPLTNLVTSNGFIKQTSDNFNGRPSRPSKNHLTHIRNNNHYSLLLRQQSLNVPLSESTSSISLSSLSSSPSSSAPTNKKNFHLLQPSKSNVANSAILNASKRRRKSLLLSWETSKLAKLKQIMEKEKQLYSSLYVKTKELLKKENSQHPPPDHYGEMHMNNSLTFAAKQLTTSTDNPHSSSINLSNVSNDDAAYHTYHSAIISLNRNRRVVRPIPFSDDNIETSTSSLILHNVEHRRPVKMKELLSQDKLTKLEQNNKLLREAELDVNLFEWHGAIKEHISLLRKKKNVNYSKQLFKRSILQRILKCPIHSRAFRLMDYQMVKQTSQVNRSLSLTQMFQSKNKSLISSSNQQQQQRSIKKPHSVSMMSLTDTSLPSLINPKHLNCSCNYNKSNYSSVQLLLYGRELLNKNKSTNLLLKKMPSMHTVRHKDSLSSNQHLISVQCSLNTKLNLELDQLFSVENVYQNIVRNPDKLTNETNDIINAIINPSTHHDEKGIIQKIINFQKKCKENNRNDKFKMIDTLNSSLSWSSGKRRQMKKRLKRRRKRKRNNPMNYDYHLSKYDSSDSNVEENSHAEKEDFDVQSPDNNRKNCKISSLSSSVLSSSLSVVEEEKKNIWKTTESIGEKRRKGNLTVNDEGSDDASKGNRRNVYENTLSSLSLPTLENCILSSSVGQLHRYKNLMSNYMNRSRCSNLDFFLSSRQQQHQQQQLFDLQKMHSHVDRNSSDLLRFGQRSMMNGKKLDTNSITELIVNGSNNLISSNIDKNLISTSILNDLGSPYSTGSPTYQTQSLQRQPMKRNMMLKCDRKSESIEYQNFLHPTTKPTTTTMKKKENNKNNTNKSLMNQFFANESENGDDEELMENEIDDDDDNDDDDDDNDDDDDMDEIEKMKYKKKFLSLTNLKNEEMKKGIYQLPSNQHHHQQQQLLLRKLLLANRKHMNGVLLDEEFEGMDERKNDIIDRIVNNENNGMSLNRNPNLLHINEEAINQNSNIVLLNDYNGNLNEQFPLENGDGRRTGVPEFIPIMNQMNENSLRRNLMKVNGSEIINLLPLNDINDSSQFSNSSLSSSSPSSASASLLLLKENHMNNNNNNNNNNNLFLYNPSIRRDGMNEGRVGVITTSVINPCFYSSLSTSPSPSIVSSGTSSFNSFYGSTPTTTSLSYSYSISSSSLSSSSSSSSYSSSYSSSSSLSSSSLSSSLLSTPYSSDVLNNSVEEKQEMMETRNYASFNRKNYQVHSNNHFANNLMPMTLLSHDYLYRKQNVEKINNHSSSSSLYSSSSSAASFIPPPAASIKPSSSPSAKTTTNTITTTDAAVVAATILKNHNKRLYRRRHDNESKQLNDAYYYRNHFDQFIPTTTTTIITTTATYTKSYPRKYNNHKNHQTKSEQCRHNMNNVSGHQNERNNNEMLFDIFISRSIASNSEAKESEKNDQSITTTFNADQTIGDSSPCSPTSKHYQQFLLNNGQSMLQEENENTKTTSIHSSEEENVGCNRYHQNTVNQKINCNNFLNSHTYRDARLPSSEGSSRKTHSKKKSNKKSNEVNSFPNADDYQHHQCQHPTSKIGNPSNYDVITDRSHQLSSDNCHSTKAVPSAFPFNSTSSTKRNRQVRVISPNRTMIPLLREKENSRKSHPKKCSHTISPSLNTKSIGRPNSSHIHHNQIPKSSYHQHHHPSEHQQQKQTHTYNSQHYHQHNSRQHQQQQPTRHSKQYNSNNNDNASNRPTSWHVPNEKVHNRHQHSFDTTESNITIQPSVSSTYSVMNNDELQRILLHRDARHMSSPLCGIRVKVDRAHAPDGYRSATYIVHLPDEKAWRSGPMAELAPGDEIVELNGIPLRNKSEIYVDSIINSTFGEIELVVKRNNERNKCRNTNKFN